MTMSSVARRFGVWRYFDTSDAYVFDDIIV